MVTVNSGACNRSNSLVPYADRPLPAVKKNKRNAAKRFIPAPSIYPLAIRIMRLPEVVNRVGLQRAAIYQHIAKGSFPKQIAIGERAVGWLEHEIDAWLQALVAAREF